MTDRVLVTGASGFIGHHVVQALLERGDQVSCLVRPTSDLSRLPTSRVKLIVGDVIDAASLDRAVEQVDTVFHLAGALEGTSPELLHQVNVEGSRKLAVACARRGTPPVLVVVSSLEAAGPSQVDRPLTEGDPPRPVTQYGRSKLEGERAAAEQAKAVPTTIVRAAGVFGEYDREILNMLNTIQIAGLSIYPLPVARTYRVSVIHARDLADSLILAAQRGERTQPFPDKNGTGLYYAAYDVRPTVAELLNMAAEGLSERQMKFFYIPKTFAWIYGGVSELWVRARGGSPGIVNLDKVRLITSTSVTCSPEKMMNQLGFSPSQSLDARVRQTAAWYEEQGWL